MDIEGYSRLPRVLRFGVPVLICLALSGIAQARSLIENHLGMRFVQVPAGSFLMGTAQVEKARAEFPDHSPREVLDETPQHEVIISQPFYLAETEVTQAQWLEVMENRPGPAAFWQHDDWQRLPMAAASWHMAQRFADELTAIDPAYRYRLPSEAEWEYAARAGTAGLRPVSSDRLDDIAWYIDNSGDVPRPVATREPNAFGLYDTLGNVWEWVQDWYAPDSYTRATRSDPEGPREGRSKVRRGGSYHCPRHLLRPAYRAASDPARSYSVQGFRLVLEPKQTQRSQDARHE